MELEIQVRINLWGHLDGSICILFAACRKQGNFSIPGQFLVWSLLLSVMPNLLGGEEGELGEQIRYAGIAVVH